MTEHLIGGVTYVPSLNLKIFGLVYWGGSHAIVTVPYELGRKSFPSNFPTLLIILNIEP